MSNRSSGKKNVMEEYLSSLLTEEVAHSEPLEQVSKLLDSASVLHITEAEQQKLSAQPSIINPDSIKVEQLKEAVKLVDHTQPKSPEIDIAQDTGIYTEPFQTLIFEVAGLSLALPLTELGGIHQLTEVTPIFGKPSWFKGVMLHRDEKMNVVDTAMWVMPDKCNEKLADSAKNQYLIMLDDSGWGLACERIIDTITLQPDDVKWRKFDGKRTWLSGMVKKKMCALVNVKQLIRLLQQGMNSNDN
ncbi:chemotaxis protein CheW [Paraglaciecola chathamensis]|uniref:chemotaxis protein CheW n=1 Tax=Paraglaciecola chathamensis TaxID=368405 RepID=UPI00270205D1|nr:chemotaxis protein CheW [Paraglaciecola chathamensis]MDO6558231.1 chemotaxis protein CheW [Paraglaciecola chathamensis]